MSHINIFTAPAFSNLELIYFGKSYSVNREIFKIQSKLLQDNETLNIITLPSVEGPIDELFKYFYGSNIQINKENSFFFEIMSTYLDLQDETISKAAKQFLPENPTTQMVSKFFNSQKDININIIYEKHANYFKQVVNYLKNDETAYISHFAVDYIIDKSVPVDFPASLKIMENLFNDLRSSEDDRKELIEKTIVQFVEKYPALELFEMILKCPFFDISKISQFKEILSSPISDQKYSENGYFSSNSDDDTFSIETNHSNESTNKNCFEILNEENPTFVYTFNSFKFDVESYSFKSKNKEDFPLNWSFYVSKDSENFEEVHRCENSMVFQNNEEVVNFKVNKVVTFVKSVKFVLFRSSNDKGDGKCSLNIENFDIFGTWHKACNFKPARKVFESNSRTSLLAELANRDPLMLELIRLLHLDSSSNDTDNDDDDDDDDESNSYSSF